MKGERWSVGLEKIQNKSLCGGVVNLKRSSFE
jgi:hypothetical protein